MYGQPVRIEHSGWMSDECTTVWHAVAGYWKAFRLENQYSRRMFCRRA